MLQMKHPTCWEPVSRIKWRHDVILGRGIMTLYMCAKTVTISSRGPPNLSNFLFERQNRNWLIRYDKIKVQSYITSIFVFFIDQICRPIIEDANVKYEHRHWLVAIEPIPDAGRKCKIRRYVWTRFKVRSHLVSKSTLHWHLGQILTLYLWWYWHWPRKWVHHCICVLLPVSIIYGNANVDVDVKCEWALKRSV